MENRMCPIYLFFNAAKGNWRNSIYIECRNCPYGRPELCSGFLLAPDADGQPVLLPAETIFRMTGLEADKEECLAVLRRQDFETLFSRWLEWYINSPRECPILQVLKITNCRGSEHDAPCMKFDRSDSV